MRCKYCNKNFYTGIDKRRCEQKHKRNKDRYWEEEQRQESMQKLAMAAARPGQTKLFQKKSA